MSGLSKGRRQAQQRAAQVLAAQRRAQARRQRLVIAGCAVAVVVLVVAVLVVVKLTSHSSTTSATDTASAGPAAPAVISAVTGVPAAVLDKVGAGKVNTLPGTTTGKAVLTDSGKPLVVYLGAEYCPYCAAERWAVVAALSRFGTFSNLGQTHSSSTDVFPDTQTLSFHGASYTSQYLAFQGVETQTNQRKGNGYGPLDTPTAEQEQLLKTYDAPPYVPSDAAGSIPFIDFANQAVISGASYSPQLLAGRSAEEISAALSDPTNAIAQAVDGTANAFTTLLCQLTNGAPATVCTSPAATAYKGKLHVAG